MSRKWHIKNSSGEVINTIVASREFVEQSFEFFEEAFLEEIAQDRRERLEAEARSWRDSELARTDALVLVPDYATSEALLAYRQALRDWTDQEGFPEVERPVMES